MTTLATDAVTLRPESNGTLLSPWEFDRAEAEPGYRYELINGVVVVSPSPLPQERDPNGELEYYLRKFKNESPDGGTLDATLSEHTVNIGPHRRRVDRVIWAGLGHQPHLLETPTICVEFVSAGQANRERDYQTKRDEYQSIGVREYWVIDRFERRMTIYRFNKGRTEEKCLTERQIITTPALPGFRVPLRQLLKCSDNWD